MNTKSLPLPSAPATLAEKQIPFGRFAGPVPDVSTHRWDGSRGIFSPRRLQRKGWLYFGLYTQRFAIGFAVVDAGFIGTGFVYVYDRQTGRLIEEKTTSPMAFHRDFAPALFTSWGIKGGARRWSIDWDGENWVGGFQGKQLKLDFRVKALLNGMTTIVPSPERPFAHTYKECAAPAELSVSIDGVEHTEQALAIIDFTLGYPPRHTTWNWAAAAGDSGGKRIGLNLVAHFNGGVENSLWVDGRLIPLPQAVFVYENERSPWTVFTVDESVRLRFDPDGCRRENLRAGVLESRFIQPFGVFRGTLRVAGEEIEVELPGVVEEHFAVW